MLLHLRSLHKTYGGAPAVDGVDLEVAEGELVCILGPSGCGKTTTIGMVGGFVRPDAGRILIDGLDITELPPNVRPTSTVFQSYALFPHMSVLKNVIYGLKFQKTTKKEAVRRGEEFLELVGLSRLRDQRVTQLSGGEQQRVALARSLILRPRVLLLDEPLSNLDAKLRVDLRQQIRHIHSQTGITTLYVTHDQEEAMGLADRMVVMNQGRIEQIGAPEAVYKDPANGFVSRFLGRVNILHSASGPILARPEELTFVGNGTMVRSDGRDHSLARNGTVGVESGSHVGDEAPVGMNKEAGPLWSGQIVRRQFAGPITTYFVTVDSGEDLELDVLSTEDSGKRVGQRVGVALRSNE